VVSLSHQIGSTNHCSARQVASSTPRRSYTGCPLAVSVTSVLPRVALEYGHT